MKRSLLILISMLFVGLLLPVQRTDVAHAQEQQALVFLVRAANGTRLEGVPLTVYRMEPFQEVGRCFTDEDGQCALALPHGIYAVLFEGEWNGVQFVPAEEQNTTTFSHEADHPGGFRLFYEPDSENNLITFVLATTAQGQIQPLWDVSRDGAEQPIIHTEATPALEVPNVDTSNVTLELFIDEESLEATPGSSLTEVAATVEANIIVIQEERMVDATTPIIEVTADETALPEGNLPEGQASFLGPLLLIGLIVSVLGVIGLRLKREEKTR